jgi:hypothetical protein
VGYSLYKGVIHCHEAFLQVLRYLKFPFKLEISRTMPSTNDLADPKEYQKIFHWAETQKNGAIPSFNTRKNDPYKVCLQFFDGTEECC